jgi:hypothetical protein
MEEPCVIIRPNMDRTVPGKLFDPIRWNSVE